MLHRLDAGENAQRSHKEAAMGEDASLQDRSNGAADTLLQAVSGVKGIRDTLYHGF